MPTMTPSSIHSFTMSIMAPSSATSLVSDKTMDDYQESIPLPALGTPVKDVKFDEVVANDLKRPKRCTWHNRFRQARNHSSRTLIVTACAVVGCILVVIVVVALLLVLLPARKTSVPSMMDQNDGRFDLKQFAEMNIPSYSYQAAQRSATSPQARALAFINATGSSYGIYRLKQRYALAVLYYSTHLGDNAQQQAEFLSDDNECNWFWRPDIDLILQTSGAESRDICTEDHRYLTLAIVGGDVNGTIPAELEMLADLRYLNLGVSSVRGPVPPEL
jgi:hypothetical protein